MGREDSERQGGFPWWIVSVVAAAVVLFALVASRPDSADEVTVRSRPAGSSRPEAIHTPAPTTNPSSATRVVVRSRSAAQQPTPTTVATPATATPATAP